MFQILQAIESKPAVLIHVFGLFQPKVVPKHLRNCSTLISKHLGRLFTQKLETLRKSKHMG